MAIRLNSARSCVDRVVEIRNRVTRYRLIVDYSELSQRAQKAMIHISRICNSQNLRPRQWGHVQIYMESISQGLRHVQSQRKICCWKKDWDWDNLLEEIVVWDIAWLAVKDNRSGKYAVSQQAN